MKPIQYELPDNESLDSEIVSESHSLRIEMKSLVSKLFPSKNKKTLVNHLRCIKRARDKAYVLMISASLASIFHKRFTNIALYATGIYDELQFFCTVLNTETVASPEEKIEYIDEECLRIYNDWYKCLSDSENKIRLNVMQTAMVKTLKGKSQGELVGSSTQNSIFSDDIEEKIWDYIRSLRHGKSRVSIRELLELSSEKVSKTIKKFKDMGLVEEPHKGKVKPCEVFREVEAVQIDQVLAENPPLRRVE